MAAGDPDIGTGTTITGSGQTANVLSISWSGISRPSVDTTHLGTTTARTFMPGDLYDPGELTVEFELKANQTWGTTLSAAATTITITFPDALDWSASGFLTGLEMSVPLEEMMTCTATYKLTGAITF